MAGLPLQYPDLALHLCDQTLTPIISSSASPSSSTATLQGAGRQGASSTADNASSRRRAAALNDLAATALRARDTASRLGLGLPDGQPGTDASMTAPQHVVVTYNTGAVLIESYMDPHDLRRQPQTGSGPTTGPTRNGDVPGGRNITEQFDADYHDNEYDDEVDPASGAPLLVGLVAAPGMQSLRDARRATARLERVGRAFQHELVAEQRKNR